MKRAKLLQGTLPACAYNPSHQVHGPQIQPHNATASLSAALQALQQAAACQAELLACRVHVLLPLMLLLLQQVQDSSVLLITVLAVLCLLCPIITRSTLALLATGLLHSMRQTHMHRIST